MTVPNLFEQVYGLVRQVPSGRVVTYGQVAWALGDPESPGRWDGRCVLAPTTFPGIAW